MVAPEHCAICLRRTVGAYKRYRVEVFPAVAPLVVCADCVEVADQLREVVEQQLRELGVRMAYHTAPLSYEEVS